MSTTKAGHIARAINQIQDKPPIPEIDFTQHQLEDGNTISTQERVVKDVRVLPPFPSNNAHTHPLAGPSPSYDYSHRRAVLLS